jgi:hypothetical protein
MQWYPNYQPRDYDLVDYQEFHIRGCDVPFRGPGFDPFSVPEGSYFTCLGAAQTYGCYYERPFPSLLAERLGIPALNLAVGGATSGFYSQYQTLIDTINRGKFVILQCMAARQESNSRFAADGYVEMLKDRRTGEQLTSRDAWIQIVTQELDRAEVYLDEVRESWVESARDLIERITVPVVLFWFSQREQDYVVDYDAIKAQIVRLNEGDEDSHFISGLLNEFPQGVDRASVSAVAALCDGYAECKSTRGMGQPLLNRFTGKPVDNLDFSSWGPKFAHLKQTHNDYYPSAEMHEDAVESLLPTIRNIFGGS